MRKKGNSTVNNPDRLNAIMEGSKVVGDMITASNLRIDGEVIGNVSCPSKIVIGKNGSVQGDIVCADADIEGEVKGTISVDNLLSLKASSKITGEIKTGKLFIEEGAMFDGNCTMGNGEVLDKKTPKQDDIVY